VIFLIAWIGIIFPPESLSGEVPLGLRYKHIIIFGGARYHLISDAHSSVPYAYAQHGLKGPFQIWKFFTLMLSIRVRN
jgi:hypothetical protein